MRKILFCGALALAVAFALPAFAVPEVPADGLKMDASKLTVVFNHSTHADYKCGDCHHPVNGKEDYRKCNSAGCHDIMDKKDKSVHSYYKVMHNRKALQHETCVSCHLKVAGKDAAAKKKLTGCKKSACHP